MEGTWGGCEVMPCFLDKENAMSMSMFDPKCHVHVSQKSAKIKGKWSPFFHVQKKKWSPSMFS
jgi:hypothetical protein